MFKSIKKVIVGVLAASLMLSSVAFAADAATSPAQAPEVEKVTVKKSSVSKIAKEPTVEISLTKKTTTIKSGALSSKTTSLTINSSSKKKVTVKKGAFKSANKKLVLTVNKNYVKFEKNAFSTKKNATKKMTIKVKGLKKTSKAYKNYVKALKKAGFEGTVKAVK